MVMLYEGLVVESCCGIQCLSPLALLNPLSSRAYMATVAVWGYGGLFTTNILVEVPWGKQGED